MNGPQHVPVLLEEVLGGLQVRRGGTYADGTLGLAGHSSAIARQLGPEGTLIGFDRDPQALAIAAARLETLRDELGSEMPNVRLIGQAFSTAVDVLEAGSLDGLLADFGVSSLQLDEAERGFSFRFDAPLDMRMDTRSGETAEQVVNQADEEDLANLIYEFGDERRSRRIARAIVRARPITTTAELAKVVSAAAPSMKTDMIHPATRTFQAIRIRVNNELGEIRSLLQSAPSLMKVGGRLALISFHSLEDRIVKDALREGAQNGIWSVVTRKPVTASDEEVYGNPRSRSAKLRVAERSMPTRQVARKVPPAGGSSRGNRTK